MYESSGEAALLIATLEAAEASLRSLAAGTLDPGRMMRMERDATRSARELVANWLPERTLELPSGWAEFVELDVSIDALLARAVVRDAPLDVDLREHTRIPVVPDLDLAVLASDPSAAVRAQGDLVAPSAPQPSQRQPDPTPIISFDPEPVIVAAPVELELTSEPVATPSEDADGVNYIKYDDHAATSEDGWLDPEGAEADPSSHGYSEEYSEEYGEEYADEEYVEEVPAYDKNESFDQDSWQFGESGDPSEGRYDPYASMAPTTDRVVNMGDEEDKEEEEEVDPVDAMSAALESAYERTATELSSIEDLLADDDDDDDFAEPTQILERTEASSGPAAIQLGPEGSRILGAPGGFEEDEEDEASLIALGDAGDYGEPESQPEGMEGILGVGIVEYEDEYEEVEEEEEEELPVNTGAPVLTEDEIAALMLQATELSKRNVVEGSLLLSDVLDADPKNLEAHIRRGRLFLDLGDFARAFSDLMKANDIDEENADVKVGLGDLYFARKDYSRAIAYFDSALKLNRDHAMGLSRRGMSHYYKRNYVDAVKDLERSRRLDPTIPGVDTHLARARKKAG